MTVGVGDGVLVGFGEAVGPGFGVPVGPDLGVVVGPAFAVAVGPGFGVPVGPGCEVAVARGATVGLGVLVALPLKICGCVAKKAPAKTATMIRARTAGSTHRRFASLPGGGGVTVVVDMVLPSCRMHVVLSHWSSKLKT